MITMNDTNTGTIILYQSNVPKSTVFSNLKMIPETEKER